MIHVELKWIKFICILWTQNR